MMSEIERRRYLAVASLSSHRRKIEASRRVLLEANARGPMAISMSWGKDSCALGALAIEVLGRVTVMHLASPYALPGYDAVETYFRERADVRVVPSTRTLTEYVEWCRDIGLPHERERKVQQRVVTTIKRDRSDAWCAEHGVAVVAMGLRIDEGGPRARILRAYGPLFQRVDGTWRCNPIAYWRHEDVWAYLVSHGVPYNSRIYDAQTHGMTRDTIRNTGWLSTDGATTGRIPWLRKHFPEQYVVLLREFPQVARET